LESKLIYKDIYLGFYTIFYSKIAILQ